MQARAITIPPTSPSYKDWNNAGFQGYDLPEVQKEHDLLLQPAADLVQREQSNPDDVNWPIRQFCNRFRVGELLIDGQAASAVLTNEEILQKYILPCFDNDRAKAVAFFIVFADRFDDSRTYNFYQDKTSKNIYLITQKIGTDVHSELATYKIPGRIQTVYRWNPSETKFELDFYGASNSYIMEYVNNSDRSKDKILSDVFHATLLECESVMQSEGVKPSNRDWVVYLALWKLQANHPELHDSEHVSQMLIKIAENVLHNFTDVSKAGEGYELLFDIEKIPSEAMWLALAPLSNVMTSPGSPAPSIHPTTTSDLESEVRIASPRTSVKHGQQVTGCSADELFNEAVAGFNARLRDIEYSDLRRNPLLRLARACRHAHRNGQDSSLAGRDHSLLTQIYSQTTRLINEPATQLHIDSYLALAESAKHCHEGRKLATAMLAVAGAALLASAFLAGAGFIAWPLLTSNLIAQYATAVVGVGALYKGLSFFHDAYTQHCAMEKVSEAMVPLVPALSAA